MKGTLLLLALLVTGELGFKTTEACIPFFEVYTTILIGNKGILNVLLNKFQPTAGERAAAEKLLECYNESGFEGKFLNTKVLEAIVISKECRTYYKQDTIDKIKALLSKLNLSGK
ncbi:hypothetical protein ACRRTK_000491 [Alexandromys fortis]